MIVGATQTDRFGVEKSITLITAEVNISQKSYSGNKGSPSCVVSQILGLDIRAVEERYLD